ncbi:MAG: hypothetical protein ACK5RC_15100 [Curvibacter sp.]
MDYVPRADQADGDGDDIKELEPVVLVGDDVGAEDQRAVGV